MFKTLQSNINKFADWFIPDSEKLAFADLYVKRRFIEAIILVLFASFLGSLLKYTGIRESFPSEFAVIASIAALAMLKLRVNSALIGNIFVGFFFIALTYGLVTIQSEITTYFRWFIAIPMFSMLFMNRNSTIFWSAVIILSNFVLFYFDYPSTSILHDYQHKLYFFSDTGVFFVTVLTLIYIYFKSKELTDEELRREQEEIKKQASDLTTMQQELLQKNHDLQTYAYVVSHDLKSPIRGILSFSELLRITLEKKDAIDENVDKQLTFLTENAVQMEELVTDILRYAELSNDVTKEYKETDLNLLLDLAIKTVNFPALNERITIHKTDLPPVLVLPTQTKQIFLNLISNSIKFRDNSRELKIDIFQEDHEDYVLFSFQDNGIGIRKENLNDVFLPFKRFNNPSKYNGSGIGLANCAKVVKRHQGKIWVESVEGEGATVSFTLSKNITF